MPFIDTPDTVLANLTLEGRGLLARSKFGNELLFEAVGWQLGRGGYDDVNPVKVTPIVDPATSAVGYIEVLDNTFQAGDAIVLNGKEFIFGTHWLAGLTIPQTVLNIIAGVHDSTDPAFYRLVNVDVDPLNPNRIRISSMILGNVLEGRTFNFLPAAVNFGTDTITLTNHGLVNNVMVQIDTTGTLPGGVAALTDYFVFNATANTFQLSTQLNATPLTVLDITSQGTGIHNVVPSGNLFPIDRAETVGLGSIQNFLVTPMSLSLSMSLIDPAYPTPPTLGTFNLPEGRTEQPNDTSVSFVMRVPDGAVGLSAYGEIGVWVEVLESSHPMEIGRQVLFAYAHFPIQVKTDRDLFTYRIIVAF